MYLALEKRARLAVLLIALSCELGDFSAVIYTKENVAAKALLIKSVTLAPTLKQFGRLLGRIEEGKGEAYATKIDVRCNDRNRIIASKRILIATGGSATAEMSCDIPTSANGCLESGLHLWTKVSNMATIMNSCIGGYSAARSHSFRRIIGRPLAVSLKAEQQQPIGRNCYSVR